MRNPLRTLILLAAVASMILPASVMARGHHDRAPVKPFTKIAEPTIAAVTATSITITHNKDVPPGKKGKNAPPAEAVTKTYLLGPMTSIEVNGSTATVNDLKVGMGVNISADPPSGLDNTDPSNGGTARSIVAHDVGP